MRPEPGLTENGGLVIFIGEFGSLGSLNLTGRLRAGRPVPSWTYPQVIHKFIIFREFGSLKVLDTGLGPRAVLHITRALDLWSFG